MKMFLVVLFWVLLGGCSPRSKPLIAATSVVTVRTVGPVAVAPTATRIRVFAPEPGSTVKVSVGTPQGQFVRIDGGGGGFVVITRQEVTRAQYWACVDAGGCPLQTDPAAYCRWVGMRVPTEEELRKAVTQHLLVGGVVKSESAGFRCAAGK